MIKSVNRQQRKFAEINQEIESLKKSIGDSGSQIEEKQQNIVGLEDVVKLSKKARDDAKEKNTKAGRSVSLNQYASSHSTVTDAAKIVKNEAQDNLERAQQQLDTAQQQLDTAKEALKTAQSEFKKKQNQLKALEAERKELEKAGEKALKDTEEKILQGVIGQMLGAALNGQRMTLSDAIVEVLSVDSINGIKIDSGSIIIPKEINGVELNKEQQERLSTLVTGLNGGVENTLEDFAKLQFQIDQEVKRNMAAIMSSPEYETIYKSKEVARKQVLEGQDKLYNETVIKNINEAFDLIELQFTPEGKVQWGLSAQSFEELKQLENSTTRDAKQENRLEILLIASHSVGRLNKELQAQGSSLDKLNERLANTVGVIQNDPQVQNLWEKIIEAVKAIFQGKFSEVGESRLSKTAKSFTEKLDQQSKNRDPSQGRSSLF